MTDATPIKMCQGPPEAEEHDNIVSSEEDEDEDQHDEIIRAKCAMDGAATIGEAIGKLQAFIEYLRRLRAEGWELVRPIDDDYGFIRQRTTD